MNFPFSIFHFSLPREKPSRREGFSLVEISMVLLLFATAIGGLLSFFPVGLRLENNAISDSAQTMFALNILSQVEANASTITDWDVWDDPQKFRKAAFKDISLDGTNRNLGENSGSGNSRVEWKEWQMPYGSSGSGKREKVWRTKEITEKSYLITRSNIRYVLQVGFVETPLWFGGDPKSSSKTRPQLGHRMHRIAIWVSDRRDGDPFLNTPFVLDLMFQPDYSKIVWKGKEGEI